MDTTVPIRVPAAALRAFTAAALSRLGAPSDIADEVADSLVLANLVGHDSHGFLRLPQYARQVRSGQIRPTARPEVTSRRGAVATVEGGWGFGRPTGRLATEVTAELAAEHGTATVVLRCCNHLGRLGQYVSMLADKGLAGMAFCNSAATVAPYGGTGRALGTNPFAWAAPGGPQGSLVLDFSTAGVAEGKLRLAHADHRPAAPGLIVDAHGTPSTDPTDFYAGGALLPFGGHKGSGMSVLIDLLGGLLTGMGPSCGPAFRGGNGAVLTAVQIDAFVSRDDYMQQARQFCTRLARTGAGPTDGEVLLPGEVEHRNFLERSRDGIPVTAGVLTDVLALTDELDVPRELIGV